MKRRVVAVIMLTLLLCSCFVGYAEAAEQRASELIISCSCGISSKGTTLHATAAVSAKVTCDQIGFISLTIQEYINGKWVTVAGEYGQYAIDKSGYSISLSHDGKSGAKYRAQCKAYVKDGSLSDTTSKTSGTKTLP